MSEMSALRPDVGWGPEGREAAVCLTVDNLGEAAELELGLWPQEAPLGQHPSITAGLPWLLEQLADTRATFFVEGWSAERYPAAVAQILERGHQLGAHGWRHESWASVGDREAELLDAALAAFGALDAEVVGFRAPGGPETAVTPELLAEREIRLSSPLGSMPGCIGEIMYLPYSWEAVDAYYYEPLLGDLRRSGGDTAEPLSEEACLQRLLTVLDRTVEARALCILVWHNYLLVDPARRRVFTTVLGRLRDDPLIWLSTCREAAGWLMTHTDARDREPILQAGGWRSSARD